MSRVTRRQYRLQSWRAPACARTSLAVAAELFRVDSVVRWLDAAKGHVRVRRAAADGTLTWAGQASRGTQTRAPLPRHRREARTRR